MDWEKNILSKIEFNTIQNREKKQIVANKLAEKIKDGDVIGFGSGSTAYLTICAIAEKIKKENIHIVALPTSYEVELLCHYFHIPVANLLEKKPDWCFDGADEVNKKGWLIKGRGGAMFREKLNIVNSPITYILVDNSKIVDHLGENFNVPVECCPHTINYVKEKLIALGAKQIEIRKAVAKDGPVITEYGNIILDTKFDEVTEKLEKEIKSITGVIESGLFIGYPIEVINC